MKYVLYIFQNCRLFSSFKLTIVFTKDVKCRFVSNEVVAFSTYVVKFTDLLLNVCLALDLGGNARITVHKVMKAAVCKNVKPRNSFSSWQLTRMVFIILTLSTADKLKRPSNCSKRLNPASVFSVSWLILTSYVPILFTTILSDSNGDFGTSDRSLLVEGDPSCERVIHAMEPAIA